MKRTYTPCTFGAFGEQLEFGFGPEFSNLTNKVRYETNSSVKQSTKPWGAIGFSETKKGEHENG